MFLINYLLCDDTKYMYELDSSGLIDDVIEETCNKSYLFYVLSGLKTKIKNTSIEINEDSSNFYSILYFGKSNSQTNISIISSNFTNNYNYSSGGKGFSLFYIYYSNCSFNESSVISNGKYSTLIYNRYGNINIYDYNTFIATQSSNLIYNHYGNMEIHDNNIFQTLVSSYSLIYNIEGTMIINNNNIFNSSGETKHFIENTKDLIINNNNYFIDSSSKFFSIYNRKNIKINNNNTFDFSAAIRNERNISFENENKIYGKGKYTIENFGTSQNIIINFYYSNYINNSNNSENSYTIYNYKNCFITFNNIIQLKILEVNHLQYIIKELLK